MKDIFRKQSIETYLNADKKLPRVLRVRDLIALGVGAVIGTGIFILPGHEAANNAGPAVSIAFLLAALISGLAGMAYAELSSAMPVAGSAYSFGNILFGEIVGWLLGWSLILEYFLAVSAIATGFAAYLNHILSQIGIAIPKYLTVGPLNGGTINLIAILIIILIYFVLKKGLTASKVIENWAVLLKIIIIVLFIVVGFFYIKKVNYSPFYPVEFQKGFAGLGGIWASTASVFFAFVGFDTLAANSAETINPGKNMFRGIIGTVLISAILYTLFSLVLTGMVNYTELGVDDPAAFAFSKMGNTFALITGTIITIGALIGMFTAIMSMMFASSRLVYSIGRDGLLPKQLKSINNNTGVPKNALMLTLIIEAVFAGLVPLNELAALINGGTLLAFSVMGVGIFVLRHRKDLKNTGFKMPLYPILPAFSVLATTFFLFELPNKTKIWLLIWLSLGIIVYFAYGFKHSNINKK